MNGLYLQYKRVEEVKKLGRNERTLHRWPMILEISDFLDHTSKFKAL